MRRGIITVHCDELEYLGAKFNVCRVATVIDRLIGFTIRTSFIKHPAYNSLLIVS